jgi:hypothetical protein
MFEKQTSLADSAKPALTTMNRARTVSNHSNQDWAETYYADADQQEVRRDDVSHWCTQSICRAPL